MGRNQVKQGCLGCHLVQSALHVARDVVAQTSTSIILRQRLQHNVHTRHVIGNSGINKRACTEKLASCAEGQLEAKSVSLVFPRLMEPLRDADVKVMEHMLVLVIPLVKRSCTLQSVV